MKNIIVFLMVLSLVSIALGGCGQNNQEQIDYLKQQIARYNEEINKLESRIKDTEDALDDAQKTYDEYNLYPGDEYDAELDYLQELMYECRDNLSENRKELERIKEQRENTERRLAELENRPIRDFAAIAMDDKYNDAIALMESGKYEEAISVFEELDGYKNSDTKIADCNTAIVDGKYNDAIALMESGKYEEAISVFEELDGYKDSDAKITDCKYNYAIALMNEGKYSDAMLLLKSLNGYENSEEKIKECEDKVYSEEYKKTNIGDYINFGVYEQDNNRSNGKEEIEWIVLDKQDGKVFVVSKYALDCQPYNTQNTDAVWETCYLRSWLNSGFINSAFSSFEQAKIPTTTVVNSDDENDNTTDKIFLLCPDEVTEYIDERKCATTDYAIANGVWTRGEYLDGKPTCYWWLRSNNTVGADNISDGGAFCTTGISYDSNGNLTCNILSYDYIAVRPAMWIDMSLM